MQFDISLGNFPRSKLSIKVLKTSSAKKAYTIQQKGLLENVKNEEHVNMETECFIKIGRICSNVSKYLWNIGCFSFVCLIATLIFYYSNAIMRQ